MAFALQNGMGYAQPTREIKQDALGFPELEESDRSYLERFAARFQQMNPTARVIRVQKDFPAELSHVEYLKKSSLYEAGGVGTMQRAFTNVESTFPQEDCDENMWSRISPRFGRILNEDQFLGFFVDLR